MKVISLFSDARAFLRQTFRNPLVQLFLLIAVTAVFRVLAWHWSPFLDRDSVSYINGAAVWAATGEYIIPQFPPMPCFIIKLLIQLGMTPEVAARFYAILPGCLVPPTGYAIALEGTGNRRLARWTAILLIFHPTLLYFSAAPIRDSLYILFAGVTLWTGIRALKSRKTADWALCALFCALSWCCRHEAMEFFALAFLVLAIDVFRRRCPWRRAALNFIVFGAVAVTLWLGITLATGGVETIVVQHKFVLNHFRDFAGGQ